MSKSSIHLQGSSLSALQHNCRITSPSYVIDEPTNNITDSTIVQAVQKYNKLLTEAKRNYYLRTKQKVQTSPKRFVWEAVINLLPSHKIKHLKALAKALEEKHGWQPIHISIHQDEGYIDSTTGEKQYNIHAHILFFMLSADGLYLFKKKEWGRKKMSELQTFVAGTLKMERGIYKSVSNKERLNHRQFRQVEEEKSKLNNMIQQLTKELTHTKKDLSDHKIYLHNLNHLNNAMLEEIEKLRKENKKLKPSNSTKTVPEGYIPSLL